MEVLHLNIIIILVNFSKIYFASVSSDEKFATNKYCKRRNWVVIKILNSFTFALVFVQQDSNFDAMNSYSDLRRLSEHRSVKKGTLRNPNWNEVFKKYDGNFFNLKLDEIVKQHVNNFRSSYNIIFPYEIEHKEQHFALKTAFFGQGNYALKTFNQKENNWTNIIFKIRGQKEYFQGIKNPNYRMLQNILQNIDDFPTNLCYKHHSLLKIASWMEKMRIDPDFSIKPGEEIVTVRNLKLNNSHMAFDYVESYNACIRRTTKIDYIGFERFSDNGFSEIHIEMLRDNQKVNQKANKKRNKKE